MKVAILVESHVWGGLEAHAVDLARTLIHSGHHAVIACVGEDTAELFRSVLGDTLPLATIARPARRSSVLAWRKALRSLDVDRVVHEKGTLHAGSPALDAAVRLLFGPYIAMQQLEPPPLQPWRATIGPWWYTRRLAGYVRSLGPRLTVCVSDSVARRLHEQYGFSRDRLITIRNGVDTTRFRPDPDLRARARLAWQVEPDAVVFGTMRRLVFDKGLDVAIRALSLAIAAVPGRSLYFVIAGDGPERQALETLASELGVRDRVRFLGFCTTPWELYPGFDVFLLPSRIEALGVVGPEAMAAGCELIASRVGGIPEIIPDPALGTLVPADDADALAEALVRSVVRPVDETRALVERGRRHALADFDAPTQFGRIAALIPAP
ncbi:MAG: glycosyltransferase, partial [Vicinamibacterales bacterium]